MQDEIVTFRVSKQLKELLAAAAKTRDITVSKYLNRALIMMLMRDGYGEDSTGKDTLDTLLL
jgi:hypothetical protein